MSIKSTKNINFLSTIFLSLVIFLNSGCIKDGVRLFEMDMRFNLDIDAGLNTIQEHCFLTPDVPTRYLANLEANSIDDSQIGFINSLTATFGSRFTEINLDFIQSMEIHFLNPLDHSDREEAFFTQFIELGDKTEIRLTPSLPNLKDLISRPTVDIEVCLNFRGFASATIESQVDLRFVAFEREE